MRLAAVVLAVLVTIGQLALFAITEAQLDTTVMEQAGAVMSWRARALWTLSWSLPWAIAAGLLAWGAPRPGTAVLVTLAVMSLSQAVVAVRPLWQALRGEGIAGASVSIAAGSLALWAVGMLAAVLAWLARPSTRWRTGAPGPGALFTVAAIGAWLSTAFRSTAFAPPGAPRRFVELLVPSLGAAGVDLLIYPVTAAAVLIVAPRLRREIAGAVTLTFALPHLLAGLATLRAVTEEQFVIPTPTGVLAPVGTAVLVVLGLVWVVRGVREARADAAAQLSDAARDPDRGEEG